MRGSEVKDVTAGGRDAAKLSCLEEVKVTEVVGGIVERMLVGAREWSVGRGHCKVPAGEHAVAARYLAEPSPEVPHHMLPTW